MTTIVYANGVMASDRMSVSGSSGYSRITKIHLVRGHMCGFSGSAYIGLSLLKWFESGAVESDYPGNEDGDDGSQLLVVTPERKIIVYEGRGIQIRFEHNCHAIGSGCEFALGALAMGADARRAVEIACGLDVYSGGGVDVLRLE